jgi:hypothetical protein
LKNKANHFSGLKMQVQLYDTMNALKAGFTVAYGKEMPVLWRATKLKDSKNRAVK